MLYFRAMLARLAKYNAEWFFFGFNEFVIAYMITPVVRERSYVQNDN
jgi:hypothetical protein